MKKILAAIVDDSTEYREVFVQLLNTDPNIEFIIQAKDGIDFFEQIQILEVVPSVVFMDLSMPLINGIDVSIRAKEKYPEVRIIVNSNYIEAPYLQEILDHNLDGYIQKSADYDEIIEAIYKVHRGEKYFSSLVLESIDFKKLLNSRLKENRLADLSKRELEVVALLCEAYSAKEISHKLGISDSTTVRHKANIMRKLEAKSSVDLVLKALKSEEFLGVINPKLKLNGADSNQEIPEFLTQKNPDPAEPNRDSI